MNELRAIMSVVVGLCVLGVAAAVFPEVDRIANIVFGILFGLLGLVMAGYIGREIQRELVFRADMRALDRRDATRGMRVPR